MWLYFYQIELVGKQLEESIKTLAEDSHEFAILGDLPAQWRDVRLRHLFPPKRWRRTNEQDWNELANVFWTARHLSLFANSFNLVRYSSRGGQENQLGWRLVGFLVHHLLNIL